MISFLISSLPILKCMTYLVCNCKQINKNWRRKEWMWRSVPESWQKLARVQCVQWEHCVVHQISALCCPLSENRTCPLSSNVSAQLQDVQATSNTMSIARCNVSDDEHNVTDASVQSSCSHMNWSESSDHSVFTAVERQWFHCCRETMTKPLSLCQASTVHRILSHLVQMK